MKIRQILGKIYRKALRTFIYNDVVSALFFSKGYRKKINGATILVPFKYSWFYASTYELEKTVFIQQHCKKGDTVIDIGAHLGVFSYFLAQQVGPTGKVYSFEPAEKTFNALSQTIKFNGFGDFVKVSKTAVFDSSGELTFYVYDNSTISNGNSISAHNTIGKIRKTTVDKISLDDLMISEKIEKLSLIKIDAEGAELEILKGAKSLLNKFHPFITLEVHPISFDDAQKTLKKLYEIIIEYGYKIMIDLHQLTLEEFCAHNTYFEVLLIPE